MFVEVKILQTNSKTKLTTESRLSIIDLDSEIPNDPHKNKRVNGCNIFKQVSEAIHSESDDYDYFSTAMTCLLFSRMFANSIGFVFITLSQSSVKNNVISYTLPSLNLAKSLSELSCEVGVNFVTVEDDVVIPVNSVPSKPATPRSSEKTHPPQSETSSVVPPKPSKEEKPQATVETKEESEPKPAQSKVVVEETDTYKKLLEEKNSLSEEVATLNTQVSTLTTNLEQEQIKSNQLEKQLKANDSNLHNANRDLKEALSLKDDLQKEKERFEERIQQSHSEIQDLKQKLIEHESQKEEMNEKLKELEETKKLVQMMKAETSKEVAELSKKIEPTSERMSVSNNPFAKQDRLNIQQLKETVADLTEKVNTYRKRSTELEVSRMKLQESEKFAKQQVETLENEVKETKRKQAESEQSLKEEIAHIKAELAKQCELEDQFKEQIKNLEKENAELVRKVKKTKANRKKTILGMQESQEQTNLLLLQANEKVETLEREIRFIKKYTGVKMENFQQKKVEPMQPVKQTRSSSGNNKEMLAKRLSVTINKSLQLQLANNLKPILDNQDNKSLSIAEEEYDKPSVIPTPSPRVSNASKSSRKSMATSSLEKQGYLEKKGPKLNMYKRRYFRVNGNQLSYYDTESDFKPLGNIDLRAATVENAPDKSSKKRYVFKLEIPAKSYFLSAATGEERDEWIEVLSRAILESKKLF